MRRDVLDSGIGADCRKQGNSCAQALANNIQSFSPDGLMPAEPPEIVHEAVTRFDAALASAKIDVRATYDNALVENALQRSK